MEYKTKMIGLLILLLIFIGVFIYSFKTILSEKSVCQSKCYEEGYGNGWRDGENCICDTSKTVLILKGDED